TQHFETFAKQISVIKFDIKKSLYLVSHLIENKFGRRSITICECGHSSHDKTSYAHFYAQDDLKVGRIVNFLHEYEKNKIDSPKEGDFYSNNNKYTSKRNSKLSNYYHLIKYAFETLDVKYHFYKQYPSDHPEYAGAWTAYSTAYSTERLSRDRKIPLKKFSIHDFKAGFKKHWKILFDESFIREKKNMVQEIRLQMNLPLDKEENSSLVATEHKNKLPEKIKLAPKRNIIEKKEVTGKRIKISPVEKMPTLEVVKIPEQSDPMNLLSICRKLKGLKPMKLSQILELRMKKQNLMRANAKNPNGQGIDETYQNRNPDAPLSNVVSDEPKTMDIFETSNCEDKDDHDPLKSTPLSPILPHSDVLTPFDRTILISICQKITAIDIGYFDKINSLILKKALKDQYLDGFSYETLLDRDNYLFLKTVRGALIHKALGEEMEEQVLNSMMNICQNIDEILHPIRTNFPTLLVNTGAANRNTTDAGFKNDIASMCITIQSIYGRLTPFVCSKEDFDKRALEIGQTIQHFDERDCGTKYLRVLSLLQLTSSTNVDQVDQKDKIRSAEILQIKKEKPTSKSFSSRDLYFRSKRTPSDDTQRYHTYRSRSRERRGSYEISSEIKPKMQQTLQERSYENSPRRCSPTIGSPSYESRSKSRLGRYEHTNSRKYSGHESKISINRSTKEQCDTFNSLNETQDSTTLIDGQTKNIIDSKYREYKKNSNLHPFYESEWKKFWYKRNLEVKQSGIDPSTFNFIPEWNILWPSRMNQFYWDEISKIKTNQRRKSIDLFNESSGINNGSSKLTTNDLSKTVKHLNDYKMLEHESSDSSSDDASPLVTSNMKELTSNSIPFSGVTRTSGILCTDNIKNFLEEFSELETEDQENVINYCKTFEESD
ncbi:unnamed protein product, partial [Diamesa serratosioi]